MDIKKCAVLLILCIFLSSMFSDVCMATELVTCQPDDYDIVFVGDSRVVGMMNSVKYDNRCAYICEVAQGYEWFVKKAVPYINKYAGEDKSLVINLGVNDPQNMDKYIKYLNDHAEEWIGMGYDLFFLSVNPVSDSFENVPNLRIEQFNSKLEAMLEGYTWLDSYDYLRVNGFSTVDGLHYSKKTYKDIYDCTIALIDYSVCKNRTY